MFKECVCLPLILCCATAPGATVELKGKSSVTGAILAEKNDQIIVDIGYTVLVIPRDQVLKLLPDNEAAAQPAVAPAPVAQPAPEPAASQGFYRTGFRLGAREVHARTG